MLVDPTLQLRLEFGEIDHSPDRVDFRRSDVELSRVIVSVQCRAFPFVTEQTVPGTEANSTHYGKRHWEPVADIAAGDH